MTRGGDGVLRFYAEADDYLDKLITSARDHLVGGDPVTTDEMADRVLGLMRPMDKPEQREAMLALLLATAVQRLSHTPGDEASEA
jgi:hypothetical protein